MTGLRLEDKIAYAGQVNVTRDGQYSIGSAWLEPLEATLSKYVGEYIDVEIKVTRRENNVR